RRAAAEGTQQARAVFGRLIVSAVRRIRRLPAQLLGVELPAPAVALRSWPMEDRTRLRLERVEPSTAGGDVWTVARYLRIPGFGPRCLVDLLAAREEAAARAGADDSAPESGTSVPSPIDPARIDELTDLLLRRAPLGAAQLGELLVAEQLAAAPVSPTELAAA